MAHSRPKILIVDDRPQNLYVLDQLLQKLDVEVIKAASGLEALQLSLEHDFCLAIVDVQMPEMDGYELVELLRGNQSTAHLPVIFVSAIYSDEYHHRKGYDTGAVDFMTKPFVPEILLSKVRVFLDLYHQRSQLQTLVDQLNAANETLSRYSLQLETSAQVSHQITSILGLERLLPEITRLIRERFGCYFVGIWLVEALRGNVLLKADSRAPETQPLPPGCSIPLTLEKSIIAHVCRTGFFYLAQDVGTDEKFLYTDQLPDTRSELVLPLRLGPELLGALDIQSTRPQAFAPADVTVFKTLADQIAIAIRNAELYEDLEARVQARTAELAGAYQRLELLDRNKSDFIQVVSHELRTPLTLILGFSQMLQQDLQEGGGSRYQQQIAGIVAGAKRMHEIVNSMLDMVKIDSRTLELTVERLVLSELLTALSTTLEPSLRERKLTLTLVDNIRELPEIEADPTALSKVFDQLLSNAIKYTPDGGLITISGRLLPALDGRTEAFVELVVSDTGIGIAPEARELIFAKFYRTGEVAFHSSGRTKFKGGGPGLGLAIARGIVEAHGGHIWAESAGHDEITCPGSQFHVILPVKQGLAPGETRKQLVVPVIPE